MTQQCRLTGFINQQRSIFAYIYKHLSASVSALQPSGLPFQWAKAMRSVTADTTQATGGVNSPHSFWKGFTPTHPFLIEKQKNKYAKPRSA